MSTLSYDATGAARKALEQHLPALVADRVATRIFAKDHTLWGPDAEAESAVRLGWVEAATVSRPLVDGILALRDALKAEGVTRIVLGGMGGSSLAPEVIAGTAGVELTVLDSTDPDQVGAALADRLRETAIVVSSKSGSTLETDSQRRIFEHAFTEAGHRRQEPDHGGDRSRVPRWRRRPARPATGRSSMPTRTSAAGTRR